MGEIMSNESEVVGNLQGIICRLELTLSSARIALEFYGGDSGGDYWTTEHFLKVEDDDGDLARATLAKFPLLGGK